MHDLGTGLPTALSSSPLRLNADDELELSGAVLNVPAMLIIIFLATLLSFGVRESARFNDTAVALKLGVLTTFVMYGVYYSQSHSEEFSKNITPFIPPNTGVYGQYGVTGIFRGAGAIFFAYVGFDSVCSMAAECKNPNRDLPRGLFATLVICTLLYILVTICLCGLMKYDELNVDSPVIAALIHVDAHIFFRWVVEIGTIAGLTSVCLISLMSQPRLLYAMARDGLLPPALKFVHPEYKVPTTAAKVSGVVCAILAGTMPLDFLGELISFGTLVAFSTVCVAVLLKRRDHPNMHSPFLVPYSPLLPSLGIAVCLVQMFSLPPATFRNCFVLLAAGCMVYLGYSRHNSVGEHKPESESSSASAKDKTKTIDEVAGMEPRKPVFVQQGAIVYGGDFAPNTPDEDSVPASVVAAELRRVEHEAEEEEARHRRELGVGKNNTAAATDSREL
jgi:APA family basic amino acid/polyamine antiporter